MAQTEDLPLPEQQEGSEKNIETTVEAESIDEAIALYKNARERLLNVNNWHELAGTLSAEFQLTNEKGEAVKGEVQKGLYFKIDIPGPGSAAGEGFDWVQVEEITEDNNDDEDTQYTLVRVRPSDNPSTDEDNVAHFFSEKSTSNFVVKRDKKVVTAAVYGRNEVANTSTENTIDKARNAIVGTSAIAGVSNAQWKSLVNGIIENA